MQIMSLVRADSLLRRPRSPPLYLVIPLFMKDDVDAFRYFKDFSSQIDDITGDALIISLAKQVEEGNSKGLSLIFQEGSAERKRFEGLTRSDLPCFWIEYDKGEHAVMAMQSDADGIKQQIRMLADQTATAKTAKELKNRVQKLMREDRRGRLSLAVALEGLATMFGISNERIALVSGLVFIATMLVIALFVPSPSDFQFFVFRTVLSVSAAAFATAIPGILSIQLGTWLKASGALAVLVLVYLVNPAALVTH